MSNCGRRVIQAVLLAMAIGPMQVAAQDSAGISDLLEGVTLSVADTAIAESIKSSLISKLEDLNSLNAGLRHLEDRPFFNGFLQPLNLKFANIQTDSDENILGLTYDWNKDLGYRSVNLGDADLMGFHATLKATGTFTRDASVNPRDFVDSEVSISAFGSWGGTLAENDADSLYTLLNSLGDTLTGFTTASELEASPEYAYLVGEVWSRLSHQLYVTLDFSGSLEANQTFDHKQYVVGSSLGVDLKAWQPSSRLAKMNVLDWPAALLRYLAGADARFSPSGVAIPTAVLGVDRVDPTDDMPREQLGETDPYYRFTFELAYRSPILPMSGGSVYLNGSLRHYAEIDPSMEISAAGLDSFTLYSVSITTPTGLYVAYSKGQLPFDKQDTQTYELGLNWQF